MIKKTGGEHLVASLAVNGVKRIFGVPGESYLGALDALIDSDIDFIQCRHEAGAANMAEAHGKLTGQPGICFVTRGPGATQACVGVHTAFQDSTPMILLVGQVRREDEGREAFQELDYAVAFNGIAKAAFEIRDPARMSEQMQRAFALAMNGRPGPVVIGFPEDVLTAKVKAPKPAKVALPYNGLDGEFAKQLVLRICASEKPFIMVGGPGWDRDAIQGLEQVSEQLCCPVITSFRAKHLFDNTHSNYAGEAGIGANSELVKAMRECDLLIAIGPRLGEMTTQSYDLFDVPNGVSDRLIHIHPSADDLNRVYAASQSATANSSHAIQGLLRHVSAQTSLERQAWCKTRRADYEAFTTPVEVTGPLNPSKIWSKISDQIGQNAIMTNGAGNFAAWLHRFYHHQAFPSQLGPTSGAMGYGLPAAIAAKLEHPDRPVIAVCGDGDFMMASTEMATAMQHGTNIIVCVFDNSAYGTIRMHQELKYPERVSGTELVNPDFKIMAESFGFKSYFVDSSERFIEVFQQNLDADQPVLIHAKQSLNDIAPGKTINV